jgi:predicted GNAT family acetyltransferase
MNIHIEHDEEINQFFSKIDGKISYLKYTLLPDKKTLNLRMTYVPPELRGQQIAGKIVKFALEYAKENNYKIIPSCSYVEAYIKGHPEYKNIVLE